MAHETKVISFSHFSNGKKIDSFALRGRVDNHYSRRALIWNLKLEKK